MEYARLVSGITFIKYSQSQKIRTSVGTSIVIEDVNASYIYYCLYFVISEHL